MEWPVKIKHILSLLEIVLQVSYGYTRALITFRVLTHGERNVPDLPLHLSSWDRTVYMEQKNSDIKPPPELKYMAPFEAKVLLFLS